MQATISITNLSKTYHHSTTPALERVNLSIKSGTFFALLGPNGAGKTTLISILTTMLRPTSGQVEIESYQLGTDDHLIRRQIGIIFQNPSLDLKLTAEENVRFQVNLYGLYPYRPHFSLMSKSYQTQISDLAEILGISDQLHQPVSTLSGGMKRKFEIIRALLHQPKVLFLDEPTTGLDPISRQQLWQYLQQVRKTHQTTIFLTTHYLDEAEPASQICILNRGKIVAQGSPQAIKDQLISHQISVTSSNTKKLHRLLHQHKLKFSGSDPTIIYPDNPNPASIINLLPRDITSFQHHHPTLEQAYIQIVNKPESNV